MIEVLKAGRAGLGKTLEVGAGCGYQAAVLAQLTDEVYAIERLEPLIAKAKLNLRQVQEFRVRLKHGDGQLGLPEAAPFDTIILAAAAQRVPPVLLQQLSLGGRMMLPLAMAGGSDQVLSLIERRPEGFVESRLDAVRFVPLLSGIE
jgi:protein-L-isoaspartate(D-aspartate) O-methyltransferase